MDDKEGHALIHGCPVFDKLLPRLVPGVLGQIQSVYDHKTVVHKPMSDVMVGLYLTGSLVLRIYSWLGRDKRIQRKQTLKSKRIQANLSKKDFSLTHNMNFIGEITCINIICPQESVYKI